MGLLDRPVNKLLMIIASKAETPTETDKSYMAWQTNLTDLTLFLSVSLNKQTISKTHSYLSILGSCEFRD